MQMLGEDKKFTVECARCKASLETDTLNHPEYSRCPSCDARICVVYFPAAFRETTAGKSGETLVVEDEAGCFYHPGKKAEIPCSICGRFLCALCDVELSGRHLCPPCIEAENKPASGNETNEADISNHRILYDKIALMLAVLPLFPIFWFFSFMTAPAAIYIVIRYWKSPLSIFTTHRLWFVVSMIIAIGQIGVWIYYIHSWIAPVL